MSERLLRLAVLALPRDLRERDGEVVLDCACEMIDAGASAPAQAAGIVAAGIRSRARRTAGPAAHAPWGMALDRLALPLAIAALALFAAGTGHALGTGRWAPAMALAAAVALAGVAFRARGVAVTGWALLLLGDLYAVLQSYLGNQGSRFSASLGWLSVDVPAAALPMLVLGLLSGCALRADGPRRLALAAAGAVVAAALGGLVFDAATTPWRDPHAITALLAVLLLAPVLAVAHAAWSRRAEAMAGAALLLAAAAPELVWLGTGIGPYPGPAGAFAILVAGAAVSAAAIVRLARGAGARAG